jgi:hypothetical protein
MNDVQLPEVLHLWLQRARSDLALGEAALQTPGVLPEDACFHAQQCAEFHVTRNTKHVFRVAYCVLRKRNTQHASRFTHYVLRITLPVSLTTCPRLPPGLA